MSKKKTALLLFLLSIVFAAITLEEDIMHLSKSYQALRQEMVENQIKARGITGAAVLGAMLKVERHRFVPEIMKPLSYGDRPLPIGEGQTISQPYIVALMTELIICSSISGETAIKSAPSTAAKRLKVLEIGTGSGYQAAILAEIAAEVYTIEIVEPLGVRAQKLLEELGYKNIYVKIGDGYKGWPEKAPFDRIIVTCAPEEVPDALLGQLAADGGRMIIPVGEAGATQKLVLIKREGDKYIRDFITYVMFVPMVGQKDGVK